MASDPRRPSVLWAQQTSETDERKNRINITINLPDIIESTVNCVVTKSTISFNAKIRSSVEGVPYAFNCNLYAEVQAENIRTVLSPQFFSIALPKMTGGVHWPHLMRRMKQMISAQQMTKPKHVPLGEAEIEQVVANLERGVRINRDGNPVRREDLYSMVSHDQSPIAVPGTDGGVSSFEDSGQPIAGEDDPGSLNNHGVDLVQQFERRGDAWCLKLAIEYFERSVNLTPDRHSEKPVYLTNLGGSFVRRFQQLGNMSDIELAVTNLERAVQLTPDGHPGKPGRLNSLGTSFMIRFKQLGDVTDIAHAVLNLERAVQLTPDGHPDKPNIAHAVLNRERAVKLTPDGHPDKPSHFNNLGTSFMTRFKQLGDVTDMENAILNLERAFQLTPDGHPDKPSCLNNLGTSLLARFERLGDVTDMENAVSNLERAIQLTPDGHPDKPSHLNNLGTSFMTRFERLGDVTDVENAISNLKRAVQLTPDNHPDKPGLLGNLDMENAFSNHERAVQLTPDGHQDKPFHLHNLGNSFLTRFKQLEDMPDIEHSIANHELAVELTPDGHSDVPTLLFNLGNSLSEKFRKTGHYHDLEKSIVTYATSASSPVGPPSICLKAATTWSVLALGELRRFHPSDQSALDAYRVAFDLLPRVAWVGLNIETRHHHLLAASSLACDAAAVAISANDPHIALAWLEQGRSIVWGQILQLRTPVEELRLSHPELAVELTRISKQLERGASDNNFGTGQHRQSREDAGQQHRQLARDWDRIVEQVRQKPGFEHFLLPKQFSELRNAARDGPVVVVNVSKHGCDALIIEPISEHLHHVRLEDFSYKKAQTLGQLLHSILSQQNLRARCDDRGAGPVFDGRFRGDDAFRPILAELWKSLVNPVLEYLESLQIHSPMGDGYFRITWCPTGPLAFLPIHAAGLYNADGTSSISLPDIAISSYTPTLTALLSRSQSITPHGSTFKLLAVVQPNTPGADSLPGTRQELEVIRKHIVSDSSVHVLEGPKATTEEVSSRMEECSWVHLACHGVQDVSRPMESGLLLQDGRLELSKIVEKRLDHAEFAFLSACQTATGDVTRPEEAIHLAAGMLLAGYRGVVATMWSIRDDDAPFVADKFYGRVLENGQPNHVKPAEALHFAIRELRQKPGGCKFSSWVPFIYMGQ
ncbi:hypothetical protein BD410DRAFT_830680 [Rickenella mellea]|uniref:CS domain-containing protein n=1 Tax=Rickenella mellea TaxID=50990 RepID=A0A4Y7PUL9_9AGAM|nr:hypothetical protein BD410DRAFT_830680 [Rickenella mellea]